MTTLVLSGLSAASNLADYCAAVGILRALGREDTGPAPTISWVENKVAISTHHDDATAMLRAAVAALADFAGEVRAAWGPLADTIGSAASLDEENFTRALRACGSPQVTYPEVRDWLYGWYHPWVRRKAKRKGERPPLAISPAAIWALGRSNVFRAIETAAAYAEPADAGKVAARRAAFVETLANAMVASTFDVHMLRDPGQVGFGLDKSSIPYRAKIDRTIGYVPVLAGFMIYGANALLPIEPAPSWGRVVGATTTTKDPSGNRVVRLRVDTHVRPMTLPQLVFARRWYHDDGWGRGHATLVAEQVHGHGQGVTWCSDLLPEVAQPWGWRPRPLRCAELRLRRETVGASPTWFASRLDVDPSTLSRWETYMRPSNQAFDLLREIETWIDATVKDLTTCDGPVVELWRHRTEASYSGEWTHTIHAAAVARAYRELRRRAQPVRIAYTWDEHPTRCAELRTRREAVGATVDWLAKQVGVDRRTLTRWETTHAPDPAVFDLLTEIETWIGTRVRELTRPPLAPVHTLTCYRTAAAYTGRPWIHTIHAAAVARAYYELRERGRDVEITYANEPRRG